jgi:hypothetical protein
MNGCGILIYASIAKVVAGFSGSSGVIFLFLSGAATLFPVRGRVLCNWCFCFVLAW